MEMFLQILNQQEIFRDFTPSELRLLLEKCEKIEAPKGRVLIKENQKDDNAVYFIAEGIVKITKVSQGREKILAMFGLGNIFGEMSFLDGRRRSATATADEDVVLYKLDPQAWREEEARATVTAVKFLKILLGKLTARLRQTDDALVERAEKIIVT